MVPTKRIYQVFQKCGIQVRYADLGKEVACCFDDEPESKVLLISQCLKFDRNKLRCLLAWQAGKAVHRSVEEPGDKKNCGEFVGREITVRTY
jgi:hypothetical protein